MKNQICTELKLLPNTFAAFVLFQNGEKERVGFLRPATISYSLETEDAYKMSSVL